MSEWSEYRLGDLVETNRSNIGKDYGFSRILYLDTGSITRGRIDGYQEISLSEAPSRAKRLVSDGDIIYSAVRPIQRHYGFIIDPPKNLVVSTGFVVITCDERRIYPKFLYYHLSSDESVAYLDTIAEGSTSAYPSLKPSDIESLDIVLPDLSEQEAITAVLASLDDKIDLLHRQNKTLEALAQTLFRHWFIDGASDEWEEKPVNHFGDVICGKTPSKKNPEYFEGNIPFIKIPDMHGQTFIFETSDRLSELGKKSQSKKTLPPRSINVSCIATVGLVTMNAFESQTNQQINTVVPFKDWYRYFLYLMMIILEDELVAMASGGTATLNLNTGDFSRISIICPPENLLRGFHDATAPLFEKIYCNQSQIGTLEKLRDTLLPKLMSGEVRVRL